jgi:hypothetical protein
MHERNNREEGEVAKPLLLLLLLLLECHGELLPLRVLILHSRSCFSKDSLPRKRLRI